MPVGALGSVQPLPQAFEVWGGLTNFVLVYGVNPQATWHCQVALAFTQVSFALGAVYYKFCLMRDENGNETALNPIVFAFARELVAGSILCVIAFMAGALLHISIMLDQSLLQSQHCTLSIFLHRRLEDF